jgi:hypothetical protein
MVMVPPGIEAVKAVAFGGEGREPSPRAHVRHLWRGEGLGWAVGHGVSTSR